MMCHELRGFYQVPPAAIERNPLRKSPLSVELPIPEIMPWALVTRNKKKSSGLFCLFSEWGFIRDFTGSSAIEIIIHQ